MITIITLEGIIESTFVVEPVCDCGISLFVDECPICDGYYASEMARIEGFTL